MIRSSHGGTINTWLGLQESVVRGVRITIGIDDISLYKLLIFTSAGMKFIYALGNIVNHRQESHITHAVLKMFSPMRNNSVSIIIVITSVCLLYIHFNRRLVT